MDDIFKIANEINNKIGEELFPDITDKPLFCDLFNKLYENKIVTMNTKKIWLESNEFYEIFEKILNDNIPSEVDIKEVLEYFKPRGYNFPPYVLTEEGFKIIESAEYNATVPVMKRVLYLLNFAREALELKKDKEMVKIGNELEILIRPELQTPSLDTKFKEVLKENN